MLSDRTGEGLSAFVFTLAVPCLILRTSRFFPEADDNPALRDAYADANIKVN